MISNALLTDSYYEPRQNIPETSKTYDWACRNVDRIISMCNLSANMAERNAYNRYNGTRDLSQFQHITATYGIDFPAGKLKHFPLIRPMVNKLASEQRSRPFDFSVRAEDAESIYDKLQQISDLLLMELMQVIMSGEDVEAKMAKLQKQYQQDFSSELEKSSHFALQAYLARHQSHNLFNDGFLDKAITGREITRVTVTRPGEDPVLENIKPGTLWYGSNNVKWISQTDWAMHPSWMTAVEILDMYGEKMTSEQVGRMEGWIQRDPSAIKLHEMSDMDRLIDSPDELMRVATQDSIYKHNVYYVEWKSIRKLHFIENENRYAPDAPFIKYIPEDKLTEIPKGRQPNLRVRYIQDLWHGIRIDDTMFVDVGKVRYPVRSFTEPSKVNLSFEGLTYNGAVKAWSTMLATADLQDEYDIMHFHKSNLIAMSGVAGSVMDLSQLPDFGTGVFAENLKMWLYYKKMGALLVDRSAVKADRQFNQFGHYDDSPGQGISVIQETINALEGIANNIVGVNRQRMGNLSSRDGKYTTQAAIGENSLVTEVLFDEHDEHVQRVLSMLLNAMRIAYKDGMTGFYVSGQHSQEIFTLTPEFSLADLGVYLTNRISDARSIQDLKAFAYEYVRNGQLQLDDIFPFFRKTNLRDLEDTIKANLERRKAELEAKTAQINQLRTQLAIAKEQGEVDLIKAQIQNLMAETALLTDKARIEQDALDADSKYKEMQQNNEAQRVDLERQQITAQNQRAVEVRNK
jgi:hypothetical protein